jgi:hypothetical protein
LEYSGIVLNCFEHISRVLKSKCSKKFQDLEKFQEFFGSFRNFLEVCLKL